jgi:hypothetical protein
MVAGEPTLNEPRMTRDGWCSVILTAPTDVLPDGRAGVFDLSLAGAGQFVLSALVIRHVPATGMYRVLLGHNTPRHGELNFDGAPL